MATLAITNQFPEVRVAIESGEPLKALDRLTELVQLSAEEIATAIETAQGMRLPAKHFLEKIDTSSSCSLCHLLSSILETLFLGLDSIVSALGVTELFKPSESGIEADFKANKVMMLLSLFTMLTGILMPLLGVEMGALIIGGSLLSIVILSLLIPLFRPAPTSLPRSDNWSKQIRDHELAVMDVGEVRKAEMDLLADALNRTQISKKANHPLLLGESRMGKTETAKAFAQAIERGDYPEFKGKQVFYFNCGSLLCGEIFGGGNKIFQRLDEAIGRHRNDILLVLDEIHVLCQKRDEIALADQLLSHLDPGKPNSFPYVVGITTQTNYERDMLKDHEPLANRFSPIAISPLSPEESLSILYNFLLLKAPQIPFDNAALAAIPVKIQEALGESAPQPASSIDVLSRCIDLTSARQKSEKTAELETHRKQIFALVSADAAQHGAALFSPEAQERRQTIRESEKTLLQLERDMQLATQELARFFQLREELVSLKKTLYQTAQKVATFQQGLLSSSEQREVSAFHHLGRIIAPALETFILEKGRLLGVKTLIDADLIQTAIAAEQEKLRQKQQALKDNP